MTTEARLIEMEIKFAYQEDLLQELNSIVAKQQSQIMRLEKTCTTLYERMKSISSLAGEIDDSGIQLPPHY